MKTVIGLVGYRHDVDHLAPLVDQTEVELRCHTDRDGALLIPQVEAGQNDVQGWIMATPGLLDQVHRHLGSLPRPAAAVRISGATLVRALLEPARAGRDLTKLSVDCVTRQEVISALTEAKIDTTTVRVLEDRLRRPQDADALAFHRRQRRRHRAALAVTRSWRTEQELTPEMDVIRLLPSEDDVRTAVQDVVGRVEAKTQADAQIALGLIDFPGDPAVLAAELARIGATLARPHGGGDEYLMITTRGSLSAATGGLVRFVSLRRLAESCPQVHVGIGLGQVAPEAERLAGQALSRARKIGPVAAVVHLRSSEIVLEVEHPELGIGPEEDFEVLSRRSGLSVATIERLHAAFATFEAREFTARELAEKLPITPDRVRRILTRLEAAGLVRRIGTRPSPTGGRPQGLFHAEDF